MTQVTEPFPIFYDDDGTPLENGMIYIGQAGLNPRSNPVQVYYDEALTVLASQPIRTLGGRPAYQGAPARLFIAASAYSIEVQNRFGTPVTGPEDADAALSAAELAGTTGASLVGTTSGGTVQDVADATDDIVTLPGVIDRSIGGVIDATARGSFVTVSYASNFANKLGVNNTKPTVEPLTGARTNDTGYVAGTAEVSAIIAGYNNVNNSLACIIASQHGMIYSGTDHASIIGGSLNTLLNDTSYSSIFNSTSCTIQQRGRYATIISSDQCQLLTGASDAASGFRSFMGSSLSSTIGGRNSVVLCGVSVTNAGQYCTVLNGSTVTVGASTSNCLVGGSNHTVGNSVAANHSIVWGTGHSVNGGRNLIVGESHTSAGFSWAVATGVGGVVPFDGARVHGVRQRGGIAGRNLALDFQCSQETTDTTTTRLSVAGSSTFPTQPESSIVNGTVWVTGVSDAGACSTFRIDFTSERVGTGTPTLRANTTTTVYNGLTIVTVPTMNVTTGGIYRVQVVGLAGTNIRWDARFTGQQIVYT